MSFKAGTVLTRKTPFEDPEMEPYNEIEVVGNSPVETTRSSEWVGQLGDNLSIRPTSFGPVIDRPAGELQRDYEVVSIPAPPVIPRGEVEVIEPGPSPEEQFAAVAGPTVDRRLANVQAAASGISPEDRFRAAQNLPSE